MIFNYYIYFFTVLLFYHSNKKQQQANGVFSWFCFSRFAFHEKSLFTAPTEKREVKPASVTPGGACR